MTAVVDRQWQPQPYTYHPPYWASNIPPHNQVELTGTQLVEVLEHFSKLLQQAFSLGQPGSPPSMRFVVHGGACMLLHPGLQRLSRQQERNQPNMPRRTTTRDVDYLHRGFRQEYGYLPDAERRLKECILYTAVAFKLGADWMNADADVALPMATKPDGRAFDPIYDASLNSENVRLHTVYQSLNGSLTLVSVSPFWSVALKLVRFAKWDPGDIVLLLRNGTVLSGVKWSAEKIEYWLKTACWPMRYDTYTPLQTATLNTRILNSLKLLNDWNRDVVGSSPPEAPLLVTGGRELNAWQAASNWQASARDPVTPQIAMGVDSALSNPPQWDVTRPQQPVQRNAEPAEESPVQITGRSLARSTSPLSRVPSGQATPFVPPSPIYDHSPERGPYSRSVQDYAAGPSRRAPSRPRQKHDNSARGVTEYLDHSVLREHRQPHAPFLGAMDRALQAIIDRGEIAYQPGIINIVPGPPAPSDSPTSSQLSRRQKEKQRATDVNRARSVKRRQDYAHSDSDSDSSEEEDSDDDDDKENRRGRPIERGRQGRRLHDIYAPNPNTPGPNTQQPHRHHAPEAPAPVELKWYEVPARIGPGPGPAPRPPPRAPSVSPEPEFARSRSQWGTDRRRPELEDSQSVNIPAPVTYPRHAPVIPPAMTRPAPVVQQAPVAPVIPPPPQLHNQDSERRRRPAPTEKPWEQGIPPPEGLTTAAQLAQYQFEEQRRRFEQEKEVKRQLAERERQFYQPPATEHVQPVTQAQQAQERAQQQELQRLEHQRQQQTRQALYQQYYQQRPPYPPTAVPPHPWTQQPQPPGGYRYR